MQDQVRWTYDIGCAVSCLSTCHWASTSWPWAPRSPGCLCRCTLSHNPLAGFAHCGSVGEKDVGARSMLPRTFFFSPLPPLTCLDTLCQCIAVQCRPVWKNMQWQNSLICNSVIGWLNYPASLEIALLYKSGFMSVQWIRVWLTVVHCSNKSKFWHFFFAFSWVNWKRGQSLRFATT